MCIDSERYFILNIMVKCIVKQKRKKHYIPPSHQAHIFGFLHIVIMNLFKTQHYGETINFTLQLLIKKKKMKSDLE